MWITQTYLGSVEPDASLYIYYFYEDNVSEQQSFTNKVQQDLEKLGDAFGDTVSLQMPNPRYADKIEAEVREIQPLWMHVRETLPGLLISPVPLVQLEGFRDDCYYIPFDVRQRWNVAETIKTARALVSNELAIKRSKNEGNISSKYRKLGDAIELKPGLFGFRIDLKKLFCKSSLM